MSNMNEIQAKLTEAIEALAELETLAEALPRTDGDTEEDQLHELATQLTSSLLGQAEDASRLLARG